MSPSKETYIVFSVTELEKRNSKLWKKKGNGWDENFRKSKLFSF